MASEIKLNFFDGKLVQLLADDKPIRTCNELTTIIIKGNISFIATNSVIPSVPQAINITIPDAVSPTIFQEELLKAMKQGATCKEVY